jgi:antitoxin YefM
MTNRIRQKIVVGKGGSVLIPSSDLPAGTVVDVIVLTEPDELDTTEYLLSDEETRQRLLEAIEHVERRENLVVISPEEWSEKYRL